MSKELFTPGPWSSHRVGASTIYIESRIRIGVLQEVAACGPTEAGPEQQEANARLIAAAPDLLKALQRICVIAEDMDNAWVLMDEVEDGVAAIKKALGEE